MCSKRSNGHLSFRLQAHQYAGAGPISFPIQLFLDACPHGQSQNPVDDCALERDLPIRTIARGRKQGRHHRGQTTEVRLFQITRAGNTKVMDQISSLVRIPPAQEFNLQSDRLQSGLGPLDLDLQTSMGEEKWMRMIKKNLHERASF